MTKLKGNYQTYEMQRDISNKSLERKQKVVEKKRQQLEKFTKRFHAQPNRASAVRNKRKMIEKLEKIDLPQERKSIKEFEFAEVKPSGYVVAQAEQIHKSYGEKNIYQGLDFEIIRGQKMCLVGPNGAGKSTLLKMLAGVLEADAGNIKYGHQVDVGYFSQSRLDVLNPSKTAFDEVMSSAAAGTPSLKARSLLGLFNYHGDDVFKNVKVLSGGEKSRLILAKLLINPPNFMLLDEPTTHLDLDGVKALTSAFKKYEGTLCFISHDLYFISEIADHIVDVFDGTIKTYPGRLDYYLEKKKGIAAGDKEVKKDNQKKNEKIIQQSKAKSKKDSSEDNNELYQKHKQALKRMNQIKSEIKKLEKEKKELDMESYAKARRLSDAYNHRDSDIIKEFGQRLKEIQKRVREIETTISSLKQERDQISK